MKSIINMMPKISSIEIIFCRKTCLLSCLYTFTGPHQHCRGEICYCRNFRGTHGHKQPYCETKDGAEEDCDIPKCNDQGNLNVNLCLWATLKSAALLFLSSKWAICDVSTDSWEWWWAHALSLKLKYNEDGIMNNISWSSISCFLVNKMYISFCSRSKLYWRYRMLVRPIRYPNSRWFG